MITFFNKQQLCPLLNKSKVNEKSTKETSGRSLKGLSKDTFELKNKAKNLSFKADRDDTHCIRCIPGFSPRPTLASIRSQVEDNNLMHGLTDQYIEVINGDQGFASNDVSRVQQTKSLIIDIGQIDNDEINSKLSAQVIKPLLDSQDKAKIAIGINIVKNIAKTSPNYANINLETLDPFFMNEDKLSTDPNSAILAINAIEEIATVQPNLAPYFLNEKLKPVVISEQHQVSHPRVVLQATKSIARLAENNDAIQAQIENDDSIPKAVFKVYDKSKEDGIKEEASRIYKSLDSIYKNRSFYKSNLQLIERSKRSAGVSVT